jgi:hypothetical protein
MDAIFRVTTFHEFATKSNRKYSLRNWEPLSSCPSLDGDSEEKLAIDL